MNASRDASLDGGAAVDAGSTIPVPGVPEGTGILTGVANVKAFDGFPALWVGDAFEGHQLLMAQRDAYPSGAGGAEPDVWMNNVGYLYGECEGGLGNGCVPPIQIHTWPACERNMSLYQQTPAPGGGGPPGRPLQVRGVPAVDFDEGDGHRLELYTDGVTVVIIANMDRRQRFRIADALVGANESGRALVRAGADLPPPIAGAMEGRLVCTAAERALG